MRILQIIPLAESFKVFLTELTSDLLKDGHEVLTVFSPTAGIFKREVDGPGEVRHLAFARGADFFKHWEVSKQLSAIIDEFQPDVVHAHFSVAILTAALARLRVKVPCHWMGTFQGLRFPLTAGAAGLVSRFVESVSSSRLDEAWVLTEDDRRALEVAAPKATVKIQKALGFGCNDRFFDMPKLPAAEATKLRETVGIAGDATVLLYIGRLVAFKGFHLAARAFLAVAEARPDMHWLIVGDIDPMHPTGLSEDELEQLKRHSQVHWLGVKEDVLPWLDISDGMLFPTLREGMPVSAMEALARRVPVLTNPVRGCRELVNDGVNGHFFCTPTVEAISQTLCAFRPFALPKPNELSRRSAWIKEMKALYLTK